MCGLNKIVAAEPYSNVSERMHFPRGRWWGRENEEMCVKVLIEIRLYVVVEAGEDEESLLVFVYKVVLLLCAHFSADQ